MGGEKPTAPRTFISQVGSPPHGRGKAHPGKKSKPGTRITPAWAGKRYGAVVIDLCQQDHPRMGGEKQSTNLTA